MNPTTLFVCLAALLVGCSDAALDPLPEADVQPSSIAFGTPSDPNDLETMTRRMDVFTDIAAVVQTSDWRSADADVQAIIERTAPAERPFAAEAGAVLMLQNHSSALSSDVLEAHVRTLVEARSPEAALLERSIAKLEPSIPADAATALRREAVSASRERTERIASCADCGERAPDQAAVSTRAHALNAAAADRLAATAH